MHTTGRPRPGSRRGISELTAAIDRLLGPPPPDTDSPEVERFTVRARSCREVVRVSLVRSNRPTALVVIVNESTGQRVEFDPVLLPEVRTALDELARYLGGR